MSDADAERAWVEALNARSVEEWDGLAPPHCFDLSCPAGGVAHPEVWEVGAFNGRWTADMLARWPDIHITCFEPQDWCVAQLWERFLDEVTAGRVTIVPFALGDRPGRFHMGDWGTDGCSFTKGHTWTRENPSRLSGEGRMADAVQLVAQRPEITLAMINIEGYEYALLPHLAQAGLLGRFRQLGVQMHPGLAPAGWDSDRLRALLLETHELTWDYGDVLSAWRRRESPDG